jgi:hypothetical protein
VTFGVPLSTRNVVKTEFASGSLNSGPTVLSDITSVDVSPSPDAADRYRHAAAHHRCTGQFPLEAQNISLLFLLSQLFPQSATFPVFSSLLQFNYKNSSIYFVFLISFLIPRFNLFFLQRPSFLLPSLFVAFNLCLILFSLYMSLRYYLQ